MARPATTMPRAQRARMRADYELYKENPRLYPFKKWARDKARGGSPAPQRSLSPELSALIGGRFPGFEEPVEEEERAAPGWLTGMVEDRFQGRGGGGTSELAQKLMRRKRSRRGRRLGGQVSMSEGVGAGDGDDFSGVGTDPGEDMGGNMLAKGGLISEREKKGKGKPVKKTLHEGEYVMTRKAVKRFSPILFRLMNQAAR